HVVRAAVEARAEHPPLLRDVEHQRLDRDLAVLIRHRPLHQELGIDRTPVGEVELAQVVTRALRVLDIGLGRNDREESAQLEIVSQHAHEITRERALLVAAQIFEIRDRDRRRGRAGAADGHVDRLRERRADGQKRAGGGDRKHQGKAFQHDASSNPGGAAPFASARPPPPPARYDDFNSPSLKSASTPWPNSERYFSGGGGKGAARRIARITESSNDGSRELCVSLTPVRLPSGPIAKVTLVV